MLHSIRRQLVVPPYVSAIHLALGLGMVTAGVALVAAARTERVAAEPPALELGTGEREPVAAPPVREARFEAAPIADEIQLAFRAGGATYLRLADLAPAAPDTAGDRGDRDGRAGGGPDRPLPRPRHGAPRLALDAETGLASAIAPVREADVPAGLRGWAGKAVVLDGGCRATVDGFAVVARLVGDPVYAGISGDGDGDGDGAEGAGDGDGAEKWTAARVMAHGAPVLAARLDGCTGTYARDAALPPVIVPEELRGPEADALAAAARRAVIASPAGAATAAAWEEHGPQPAAWTEQATFTARVLRHPVTGATLVAVHAHADFACGSPEVNLWGLYRVAAPGRLAPVHVGRLHIATLDAIDRIIDIEGDGELELVGRTWLGPSVVIADQRGEPLAQLALPFYGCPC